LRGEHWRGAAEGLLPGKKVGPVDVAVAVIVAIGERGAAVAVPLGPLD
jgi:hypothetical protein